MSEEKQGSEEPVQPPAMGGMLLTMLFMFYIILNPELRDGMGAFAGSILEPRISFDHQYPAVTFLLAGITMISLTTLIRHILIDWEAMAETQNKMSAYNKEMGEARKSGNEARMRKLMALQPQIMVLQSEMMSNQMRPMMFTMLIAIPIIMWLRIFVEGMDHQVLSLPWEGNYDLNDSLWFLPHWILVYSALSLPFGQILMRGLKLVSLSGPATHQLPV
jgi:uncharacterized membrane protein (DUF106 family)